MIYHPELKLRQLYESADAGQVERGLNWYRVAHEQCAAVANELQIDLEVFCGMVAILSAGLNWDYNIEAARRVAIDGPGAVTPAYNANQRKAWELLQTGNTDLITGPKVRVFWQTLVNPEHDDPVLDRHAFRAACGIDKQKPRKLDRAAIRNAYCALADYCGVSVAAAQAVVWLVQKEV